MIIDNQLLSTLSAQAKASPRLRQNYDLRNTHVDNSQRVLNDLYPWTMMLMHRHGKTSEAVIVRRGLIERFYDEEINVTEEVLMVPGGENPVAQVEKGRCVNILECLKTVYGTL